MNRYVIVSIYIVILVLAGLCGALKGKYDREKTEAEALGTNSVTNSGKITLTERKEEGCLKYDEKEDKIYMSDGEEYKPIDIPICKEKKGL